TTISRARIWACTGIARTRAAGLVSVGAAMTAAAGSVCLPSAPNWPDATQSVAAIAMATASPTGDRARRRTPRARLRASGGASGRRPSVRPVSGRGSALRRLSFGEEDVPDQVVAALLERALHRAVNGLAAAAHEALAGSPVAGGICALHPLDALAELRD